MDLKEISSGIIQEDHWYYQSKKIPLINFVKKVLTQENIFTVYDIGSGTGYFSNEIFRKFGQNIRRIYQCDIGYSDEDIKQTHDKKIIKTKVIPPQINNSIIIMMDVLEHIEDDKEFIENVFSRCKGNNNYFFITVPAFQNIWSGHDEYLGHYRRYTIKMLKDLLSGNEVEKIRYIYGSLYPIAFLKRKTLGRKVESDMKSLHPLLNSILRHYFSLENNISNNNKLFGLTCVGEGKINSTQY